VRRLLVKANVVPGSPIIVILIMEELSSSETSVLTGATRRTIPEDDIHYYSLECYNFIGATLVTPKAFLALAKGPVDILPAKYASLFSFPSVSLV
jgi:hypothetical protein